VVILAAILETVIQKWIGTAAERAALSTTGLKVGSIFEETDTGLKYRWSGAAWFAASEKTIADVTFHSAATQAANGTAVLVGGYKTLTVEIYGTSATRTVTFYGRSASGTIRAISGIKLSDLTLTASTTGTAELWQFDVTGLEYVLMDLTAVNGGNVTVKGRLIA
jgi:hypothetical protein